MTDDPNKPSQPAAGPVQTNTGNDDNTGNGNDGIPAPRITPRRAARISWIWLVPLVAALIGASLLVKSWLETGPVVTIRFQSADGIEVGQTKLRYKDVVVGVVKDIRVSRDRSKVVVKAQLNREGSQYITRKDTRFWVVRPRLGISGVSGLGTLLSGPYIGVDTVRGSEDGPAVYEFIGQEKPPEVANDRSGRRFVLQAADLGSLEIGSPVYYRRIPVGRVIDYQLDESGRTVNIQIFVDAPNDKFVTSESRFWNASGIDFSLSGSGVAIKTGSLASVIAGGIAFATADEEQAKPVSADTVFTLSNSEVQAMADPDGTPFRVDMIFHQSVRGLKVGAPVEFRGLALGKVVDIDLEFNPKEVQFYVLVKTMLYPMRFGDAYDQLSQFEKGADYSGQYLLGPLVQQGMRAQIQPSNLLTGQQLIALDFFPDAPPVKFDSSKMPIVLPTIAGSFDRLQQQISSIVGKIDAVPFAGISNDLQSSLKSLNQLLKGLNGKVSPQAAATLKSAQNALNKVDNMLTQESSTGGNLNNVLRELTAAAKSLRALGDYLQTDPAALVRGRSADKLPTVDRSRQ